MDFFRLNLKPHFLFNYSKNCILCTTFISTSNKLINFYISMPHQQNKKAKLKKKIQLKKINKHQQYKKHFSLFVHGA